MAQKERKRKRDIAMTNNIRLALEQLTRMNENKINRKRRIKCLKKILK